MKKLLLVCTMLCWTFVAEPTWHKRMNATYMGCKRDRHKSGNATEYIRFVTISLRLVLCLVDVFPVRSQSNNVATINYMCVSTRNTFQRNMLGQMNVVLLG